MINENCPCKKKKCPRHGDCIACRSYHAQSKRKRPVYCDKKIVVRKFCKGDEIQISEVIRQTLTVSNSKDYPTEYINENIKSHSPDVMAKRAELRDIGVVPPRAIWFLFSCCPNIKDEASAEEL